MPENTNSSFCIQPSKESIGIGLYDTTDSLGGVHVTGGSPWPQLEKSTRCTIQDAKDPIPSNAGESNEGQVD